MSANRFNLRSTACSMHCSVSRKTTDSFYINSQVPGAYLADNTQLEAAPVLQQGVFAVFSGLAVGDKTKVNAIDEFKDSIINAGTVAVNACVESLQETLKDSGNYDFAMVKVKDDIAQIYYRGDCTVYIYRNKKVIPLTDISKLDKTNKDDNEKEEDKSKINFTPEFKFIEGDALILSTQGVREKLSSAVIAHIMSKTVTSKAAAQSIVLSANENHCVNDATAIVIRAFARDNAAKKDESTQKTKIENISSSKSAAEKKNEYTNFVVSGDEDTKHIYTSLTEEADDKKYDDYHLGLSNAAWVIIGVLTAALGVIAGLIVLIV